MTGRAAPDRRGRGPHGRRNAAAAWQGPAARDIRVPLPAALSQFGDETTARLYGEGTAPPIVLLGGISSDRFVFDGAAWWSDLTLAADGRSFLGIDFAFDRRGALAPTTHEQALVVTAALDAVGCDSAQLIVGASYGGMVALALAEQAPERVAALAIISAGARPHPYATAWREMQRRVIALGLDNDLAAEAQEIARGMAMLSYRTPDEFARRFIGGCTGPDTRQCSQPGAYLEARGRASVAAMTPERYLSLSASIDRHDVNPEAIGHPALLISASNDFLIPPADMAALAEAMPGARLNILDSPWGHDMFLKDAPHVASLIHEFLESL